jgi:regulator of cell morphogenesis and NO signaling
MDTYTQNTSDELTVAQLAIAQPGALAVFTKYNIDYCCGGHRRLVEACHKTGLDPEIIRREISRALPADSAQALRYESWSSGLLVDFIIENHHAFVRTATPVLEALLEKVWDRHGDDSPELTRIRECFLELSAELATHMEKEERVLFPAIASLDAQRSGNRSLERIIQGPIVAMEDDHEIAGDLVKQIRLLSNNYNPPEFACPTFQATYQRLKEFDHDLMQHIHLENNILFERYKKPLEPSGCSL